MAEMLLKARRPEFGPVRSAGTSAMGGNMDARAAQALGRIGVTADRKFRSRQVEAADFGRYDLILAMDSHNLSELRKLRPEGARARLSLLLDHVPELAGQDVPDPYYGPAAGFDRVRDMIERAITALPA